VDGITGDGQEALFVFAAAFRGESGVREVLVVLDRLVVVLQDAFVPGGTELELFVRVDDPVSVEVVPPVLERAVPAGGQAGLADLDRRERDRGHRGCLRWAVGWEFYPSNSGCAA
jgi:hypothetical protein